MNIFFIISSLQAGGAERSLSELANYWCEKGHRVTIIVMGNEIGNPFYKLDSSIKLIFCKQSVNHISIKLARPLNILRRMIFLRKYLKSHNPDMVISFIDLTNIMTILVTRGLKIPVILSERTDPFQHQISYLFKWLRLKTYSFATHLVVQNTAIASYFPHSYKSLIKIIPNAIKFFSVKNKNNTKVKKIITVGRLDKGKDHKTLIISFAQIIKSYGEDITLTIYGEGYERENLQNLITNLKLEKKVFLPGIIKDIELALLDGDLFIFPTRYEGFPNALCEAMAAHLPVIASDCAGNKNIIQDGLNGRLFPVGNVKALTSLTLELIHDWEQRKKLSNNAYNFIREKFAPEKVFLLWNKIIDHKL